jgi:hypothetical protein
MVSEIERRMGSRKNGRGRIIETRIRKGRNGWTPPERLPELKSLACLFMLTGPY